MNYMNVDTMIANVAKQANTNIASALFTKPFLIDLLNDTLAYIYSYHKWSWNVYKEEIDISGQTITTTYPIQEIISIKDETGKQYTQTDELGESKDSFRVHWNVIEFNEALNVKLYITYRRWPKKYDVANSSDFLDIPSTYNNIVRWLMLTDILPLWLGEGGGGLMVNWYNRAIDSLNKMSKIDGYVEPKYKHTKAVR